jgi:hypothetical protein
MLSEFHMAKYRIYGAISAITALCLAACSHTPDAGDIPPSANFTTKILANDTKLFVYSQRFGRGRPGGEDEPYEGGQGRGSFFGGPPSSAQMSQGALRGVQAMLAQNHYCRDGYVVLEQYDEHGKYIVRGECRDAATSADREKFAQQ